MFTFSKKKRLENKLRAALADGVLTDDEYKEILTLRDALRIDDNVLIELRSKLYFEKIGPIVQEIENRGRFSPEDEARCRAIAEGSQIEFLPGESLQKARALWQLETSNTFEPREIETRVRLGRGERCYLSCGAAWFQNKTRKISQGYVGGSVGFRIAKGVTLRVGRAVPISTTTQGFVRIADGTLYVTNKKLLFVGEHKSTNITMGRLADYHLFKNGIEIKKTSGPADFFELAKLDIEYLDALLQVI